tara:strand:+ start:27 stop:494 length:468 start_codon:yes stop_codon:yes gene_type:complete
MENQKPKIEFENKKLYKVELLFDSPKSGKNAKGNDWYLYGVRHEGIEKNFFANDYALHNKIKDFTKGTVLEIIDNDETDNPYSRDWQVTKVGESSNSSNNNSNDTEIKISTWAGMKVAAHFSQNIDELKANSHMVIQLHKDICNETKDEQELFND